MPDCLRYCVWGGRLLQPLCGGVVCGWTETRNSSIQYGRKTFHCNVHRVGTHCVLLAVAERKPVIGRETMAACLKVLGSTVGWVWYLQSLFCVCVYVCVHAYANRMIDVSDYRSNLYYSFTFLSLHCSLWMLMTRNSLSQLLSDFFLDVWIGIVYSIREICTNSSLDKH